MKAKYSPLPLSALTVFILSAVNPVSGSATELMLSASAGRTSPSLLNGRSLNGKVYIYATKDTAAKQVSFYLDDPKMSRAPVHSESSDPYDFAGTATTGLANPYDASKLVAGSHTLTARVAFTNGTTQIVSAAFNRPSTTPTPTPVPTVAPTPVPTVAPTPIPTATPQAYGKKWHPGHYLNAGWGWRTSLVSSTIARIKDNPNLKGVATNQMWQELEPQKGVYNFAYIESALAMAKAANKQLMIQIIDRWWGWDHCVPEYLRSDPIYKGGESLFLNPDGSVNACNSLRFVPEVQNRLMALYTALGKRFNNEPNFEAVYLQEDGLYLKGSNMGGYTPRGYTDQQKRGMDALAAAFPNTQVFKFLSWGVNTGELFEYAYKLGLGVGGPDLVPDENTFATPYYPLYAGKMPLHISSQHPRVEKYITQQGGTVERLYDFGVTDPKGLNTNYIVWDQPETPNISFTKQILPLLNAHNGYINSGCPLNMTCKK